MVLFLVYSFFFFSFLFYLNESVIFCSRSATLLSIFIYKTFAEIPHISSLSVPKHTKKVNFVCKSISNVDVPKLAKLVKLVGMLLT